MVNVIREELPIEETLRKKLELICEFAKATPKLNIAYGLDSKLKEKQKGKNRDITSYERKLFNERVKNLKQEISNLENDVSKLENNKKSINKQITKLNKDKDDIKEK